MKIVTSEIVEFSRLEISFQEGENLANLAGLIGDEMGISSRNAIELSWIIEGMRFECPGPDDSQLVVTLLITE